MCSSPAGNYVCVHCGSPTKYLLKKYSPTVLELFHCENCGNIADKYLEYDEVIIFIDIILFNKQAYRHLLYNAEFKNHMKLALLILITKATDEWLYLKSMSNSSLRLTEAYNENTVYELCFNVFVTLLGELLFFCIIVAFFAFFWNASHTRSGVFKDVKIIWKALISSSFGYILLLPSLIWTDFQREVHLLFIYIYTLISHIQALTVVFKIQQPVLAVILIFAIGANYLMCSFLRWFFTSKYNIY